MLLLGKEEAFVEVAQRICAAVAKKTITNGHAKRPGLFAGLIAHLIKYLAIVISESRSNRDEICYLMSIIVAYYWLGLVKEIMSEV